MSLRQSRSINKHVVPDSPGVRKETVKAGRRSSGSLSNSPAANQRKATIRSQRALSPNPSPGSKSPGSMRGGKNSIRESLRSPNGVSSNGRVPRPSAAQRAASGGSTVPRRHHSTGARLGNGFPPSGGGGGGLNSNPSRSRSSVVSPTPPARPPLETSPTVSRKKLLTSPISPRKPRSTHSRSINKLLGDEFSGVRSAHNRTIKVPSDSNDGGGGGSRSAHSRSIRLNDERSLSPPPRPRSTRKSGHARHNSLGALNYNHAGAPPPPPPSVAGGTNNSPKQGQHSPKLARPSTSHPANSSRRAKAPPPPTAMQRLSMKLTNSKELKAEKKARTAKLMQ